MAFGTRIKGAVSALLLVIVIAVVLRSSDAGDVLRALGGLPPLTIAAVLVLLILNAFAATLRFKFIAADIGHALALRESMAAVSYGGLGGALLFQLVGQLMARGAVMARSGIGFPSVVVMTLYERAVAALASGLLALAGAYFIFGRVALDRAGGGADFIKIAVGLFVATGAGALFGYGRMAAAAVAPFLTRRFAARFLRSFALSVLVQIPMMAAYVVMVHALAPTEPIVAIAAASTIVMFAASVPVSFAGWGMRELSAVVALSAVGIGAGKAFLAAAVVGTGSLLAMALLAAISLRAWTRARLAEARPSEGPKIDYARALAAVVPLATMTLVLFQIYVPIRSSLLNVNLADPLAVLGGVLFVLGAVRSGHWPRWRFPQLNIAVAAATAVLTISLLIGAARFGWTQWAVVNRYLGWFVLLCFAATGALMVREGGQGALEMALKTFAGATAAVAALEIVLVSLWRAGLPLLPVIGSEVEGFAQNHNFFAFQALMAVAALVASAQAAAARTALLALLMAGLWFSASRSGLISLLFIVGAGLYLRAVSARETARAALGAAVIVAVVVVIGIAARNAATSPLQQHATLVPQFIPQEANTAERLLSIEGGWRLFLQHPVFGAGLGAYRNLGVLATSGLPLLIHSTPLWLLAETGIVGLVVFAVPSLMILFTEARRVPRDPAAVAIVLCLVGFGVMGGPADMFYQRTFWLLIGAALACLPAATGGEALTASTAARGPAAGDRP
ncbi:MAG: flippase-like domain-containing protein [Pseudolabrys sp.]|nr:flippase-like domain-containing protein [Pseudolabrys sp.]